MISFRFSKTLLKINKIVLVYMEVRYIRELQKV